MSELEKHMNMPKEIWASCYYGQSNPEKGQNYGDWADEESRSTNEETKYIRADLADINAELVEALEEYQDWGGWPADKTQFINKLRALTEKHHKLLARKQAMKGDG